MILNQGSTAPVPAPKRSNVAAIVGRWVVILLFAGTVAGNVWQYKERQRLQFGIEMVKEALAMYQQDLTKERATTSELREKIHQQLMDQLAKLASERSIRVAQSSEQYNHSRPVPIASAPAPAVRPAPVAAQPTTATARPVSSSQPARVTVVNPSLSGQPQNESERIQRALKPKIDHFYKAKRNTGSGATLVFEVDVDYEEPRQIPGWAGRYEVKGQVMFQYYDSVWGGSFSRGTGTFTAEVKVEGTRVEVLELKAY